MTASASADVRESANPADYGDMLDTLDVAIDEAKRKVENGRVYDAENEKVRIKWIRALAYAVNVRRQVTTDRDLEELTERLETIEKQEGIDP
jgi:predicted nucleotidyltransferase component of viral defense system